MHNSTLKSNEWDEHVAELEDSQVTSKTGNYVYLLTNQFAYCSKGFLHIHQLEEPYPSFETFLEAVDTEDHLKLQAIITNLQDVLSATKSFEIQYHIVVGATQQVKVIKDILKPCFDENENIIGFRGTIQDVTEYVARENELTGLTQYLNALKETLEENQRIAGLGGWEADLVTGELTWAKGELERYEVEKVPTSFEEYLSYVHPDDRHILIENHKNIFEGQKGHNQLRFRIVTSSGKIKYTFSTVTPVFENGRLIKLKGTTHEVTELVKHEMELTRLKNDLEESQLMANVGSWEYDAVNDIQTWSVGQNKLYEVEPDEVPKNLNDFLSHIHPDDVHIFTTDLPILLNPQNPTDSKKHTFRIIGRKSDKIKTIRSFIARVMKDGKVVAFKGINQDITAQQKLLDDLSNLNNNLQTANTVLLEIKADLGETQRMAGVGSWRLNIITNAVEWSDELKQLLELPAETEPHTGIFLDMIHPMDADNMKQLHAKMVQIFSDNPSAIVEGQCRVITKSSGQVKHISFATKAILSGNEIVATKGVIKDISKEVNFHQKLEKLNDSLIQTQQLSGTGSWEYNLESGLINVSKGWCDVFEVEKAPSTYQELMRYVHPDDIEIPAQAMSQVTVQGAPSNEIMLRIVTAKGNVKHLKVITKSRTENGRLTTLSGSIMDITAFKEYESKLLQSQERLKLLFETMSQGVVYRNLSGTIVNHNQAAERILGTKNSKDQFDYSLYEPDGRELKLENQPYLSVLKTGIPIQGKVLKLVNNVDHNERWVKFDSFPVSQEHELAFCIFEDITAARTSYNLLKQSEEKFSNVFKLSGVGMAILSMTGEFADVNNTLEKISGYTAEELLKVTSKEITHPNDFKPERDKMEGCANGSVELFHLEKRIVKKDHSIAWVVMTASLVRNSNHQPLYVIAQFQDITAKVLSENKVFEYQQRFISAFHGSSVGMVIRDLTDAIVEVNDAVCALLGYTRDELLGMQAADVSHPDDMNLDWENTGKLLSGETNGYTIEKRYFHKTGKIIHGLLTVNLIRNAEAKPVNLITQIQDITEKIQVQQLVQQERQKFEHIFKYSGMGIGLANKDLKLVAVNDSLCKLLGYSEAELLNFSLTEITHPDDLPKCVTLVTQLVQNEIEKFTLEKRYIRKDGAAISVLATTTKITDSLGNEYILGQIQDVNELRREQIIRQESEERYKYVVENAYMGIGFSKGTKVVYANPALIRMLGHSSLEEYSKHTLVEMAAPETKELLERRMQLLANGKKVPDIFVGRFFTGHGTIKTLEVQAKSITLSNEPYRMAIITDLTDKLGLEKRLKETQHVFDQAQRFTGIGSWRWTIPTGELYWSDSIFPLFGYNKKKEEVSYENFLKAVHPDDKEKVVDAINKCITNRTPYEVEHRILLKNGKIKWVQEKGNVIRNEEGHAVEMYGVVREITNDKEIAEELQRSKERYQLLAESGQEMICLNANDGHFIYASPAMKLLLGYNPKRLPASLRSIDLVHPDDKQAFLKLQSSAINQKGEIFNGRFRFRHKNGSYIWCEKNIKAVINTHNEVTSIRSLTRNINQQVAFENQLTNANSQLEKAMHDLKEASEAKESFLSIMSHEIRTPLNSVIGLSHLLMRRNPREDQAEVVKTLKNSADNLMHLVNDILDFSKIRSGNVKLEIIPFSLQELLRQQHAAFQVISQDKGLEFGFQIDPAIPDGLEGDITRLNQIFTNLLTNAIKFTHKGHVKLRANLNSISRKNCSITFTVEDTGVGIPADKQQLIFQPFHQSDTDISRKYGGTGLGLSIVKSLVELMHGTLVLNSVVGKGSTFVMTMNLVTQSVAVKSPYPPSSQEPVTNNQIHNSKLNILYVEDVDSNRFLIENLLADNNMHCTAVASGRTALKLTATKKFDIILMDLQMPVMDGYTATKKIRQQAGGMNKITPIIAFTAEVYSSSLKEKTLKHSIQYVISKPFDPDQLIEKIRMHVKPAKKGEVLFAFTFYENVFNGDKSKVRKIKKAVLSDFMRFEKNLAKKDKAKDMDGLRSEVHRIRPIAKNLSCASLTHTLDKYRLHNAYNRNVKAITTEALKIVKRLISKLDKLTY